MKKLIMIGGTMGVGKTTVCQQLKKELEHAVFLDGDWCWDMDPFIVNEETQKMVLDNICFMLNSYIQCSEYEHIIFCWVMHQQEIIDLILSRLQLQQCQVYQISLVCSPDVLEKQIRQDIENGKREESVLKRSLERLHMYKNLRTRRIDKTHLDLRQTIDSIQAIISE